VGQRYSQVDFLPDAVGDLIYQGAAATVMRDNRADTLQADMATPLGDRNTLRYGVYGEFARGAQDSSTLVFPVAADGNQTSDVPFAIIDDSRLIARTASAYVQDQWDATDRLTVNGGLRYDHIGGYLDESQLSPRLGMVYTLDDQWTLHAGYARYFTPPQSELITQTSIALYDGTSNALPGHNNTDVRAMRENYYDAGVQWSAPDQALTLGLDAYFSQQRNVLDEGQFGTALIFADFNYRYGRDKGIECTANWQHGPLHAYFNLANNLAHAKLIASGQYNWSPAEIDYIADHWILLDHAPRMTGSGGLDYRYAGDWNASADYLFGSGLRVGFANTQRMPAYLQWNVALAHRFDLPGVGDLRARLAVVNLFDRAIELRNGTGLGVGIAPQYATRREVYLTLAKHF
jgi:outer membrane receptor protein involved in Fe transport